MSTKVYNDKVASLLFSESFLAQTSPHLHEWYLLFVSLGFLEENETRTLKFAELLCRPVIDRMRKVHHHARIEWAGAPSIVIAGQLVHS